MEPGVQRSVPPRGPLGSRDGVGAGDHDQPYTFGRLPTSERSSPFSVLQFARLLILRGRIQDGEFADDLRRAS